MQSFLDRLLEYYSLTYDEYAYLSRPIDKIVLKDPLSIKGMKESVDRIKKAIENKEKIIIYGDYDCDGICATSIMVKTFQKLNYPVSYYIPSRYIDGYGLNVNNVNKIKNNGFSLIITVDNGIGAFEAIDKANELGMDVIVVDHHEVPPTLVNAYSIIHPTVSGISNIIGSGGYMSLFLSSALLNGYDDYLITLAGLSTISDLMELKDYNRDVTRLAISSFNKNRYLALDLLTDNKIITEKTFSFDIAPKINSIGRVVEDTSVNRLIKYLTSENKEEIKALHNWIEEINTQRKELTKEAVDNLPKVEDIKGICLLTNYKEGLVGLIANRLLSEYNVPSIVFTYDSNDKDILKGSIRSKEGFNITKALESLDKYKLTGGGHSLAGGISIKASDFEAFKNDFLSLCDKYPITEEKKPAIDIELKDINYKNYELMNTLAPFGMGFKEPLFRINDLPSRGLKFNYSGKHLMNELTLNTKLVGFNIDEKEFKYNATVSLEGNMLESEYKGVKTLEFRISKWE